MAKDPAFLFYSSDFLTGTYTMTNEQVGKFIRLLCLQHQKKILSEKDMLNICSSYDDEVFSKFIKCEQGYYNERLKSESDKRSAFSESRRNNRKSKKDGTHEKDMLNICSSYDEHMENENENENSIINYIIIESKKIFDVLPIFEYYEAQLNGMMRENQNKDWRAMVEKWFSDHIGENFKDPQHAKNSFKRFYLNTNTMKKTTIDQRERLKDL